MTWQPMDTAPRDGTRVLLIRRNGRVEILYWFRNWWEMDNGVMAAPNDKSFAAWMPLPAMPQPEAAK